MGIVSQLYQLQEIDQLIEADKLALVQKRSQLGENQAIVSARANLAGEQKQLDELKGQQHSLEWEIEDVENKIKSTEGQLYGGKVANPKELSNLQHEVNSLKARQDKLETSALEVIDRVEQAEATTAESGNQLKKREEDWQTEQQHLSAEIDELKSSLVELEQKRQALSAAIDSQALDCYERIRKQKQQPVARVEQGICHGCRISLSSSEIQQARSGTLVQCSSCGRILFLP